MEECSTEANKRAYNTQSLVCSQRIKDYRAHKEDDLRTIDTKNFFSYVSKDLNASSDCINLKSNDGSMLTSSIDIVQCLSAESLKFFTNNSTLPNLSKPCSGDDEVRLEDISFGVDEVRKVLSSQGYSAPGPDGIPGVFYNRLAPVLALPMCIVFHQSLYQRAIPDMWRSANITPIFKGKGEREAPSSFRPISLTDVACKHLERLVADRYKTSGSVMVLSVTISTVFVRTVQPQQILLSVAHSSLIFLTVATPVM